MWKNYLKTSLRVLKKHKFFSFLNITSLSLGLFPCILLLLLLQYEYSFDTFHEKSENIYISKPITDLWMDRHFSN